jgi:hypothetical protein
MRNSFPSQIYFVLSRWHLSFVPGSCSINCTKTKLTASSAFRSTLTNKWISEARYTVEELTLGNHVATQVWEDGHAPLPGSWVAVSSIFAAPFTNTCSSQADNKSRKSRFHCGCQFPWCALALRGVNPCGCHQDVSYVCVPSHPGFVWRIQNGLT